MAVVPFRAQQCIVSLIGLIVFLPLYLFWGGVFSFSFSALDSPWAWGFGIFACWFQILAMMFSFLQPRKGAWLMLINIAVSIVLMFAFLIDSTHGHSIPAGPPAILPHAGSGFLKVGLTFWAPPFFFAFLLLRRKPAHQERLP